MNRTFTVAAAALAIILVGCNAAEAQPPAANAPAMPSPEAVAPVVTPEATLEPSPSPVIIASVSPTPIPTAIPEPTPSTVALPKLSPKVAGATKVKYFSVNGDSPTALLDNVVLRSKASCKSADTLACVSYRYNVRWTNRTRLATGACTIVAPKVGLTSTVYLPQWVGPKRIEPALLAWWKKMVDHMAWHEAQHIKIQKTYDSKLKTLMVGHKCSSANKIYKNWERTAEAAQDKFDAKDALWPYPEYTGLAGL